MKTMLIASAQPQLGGRVPYQNRGAHLLGTLALMFLLPASAVLAQSVLEDISYSTGSGGSVDIVLKISGGIPEPEIFVTDSPARIALDLHATSNALSHRTLPVGSGATRSVTAIEADGRTRVVIDLFRSAPFETREEGDRLVVTVQGGAHSAIASSAQQIERVASTPSSTSGSRTSIENIDFRRGRNGEGRIVISFNTRGANIDLQQQGNRISAFMYDVDLPESLEQRLDVLDFATPVEMVDTFRDGNRVRLNITVSGEYDHLAYQTGEQYVIEVTEHVEEQLSPEDLILQQPDYIGSRVAFNFQNIAVRSVLQLIADVSSLNIVVSDSVQGSVTLRLQNVPWDQALDIVLQAKSLDKRPKDLKNMGDNNVIWIAPAAEIASREQAELEALQQKRQLEPLRSTYIQVNYAKAVDLAQIIENAAASAADEGVGGGLLSSRGSVTVDERTNVLLITDTADRLNEIRELVNLLDRPVRQVQIEARIVIASDTFSNELGVRFGFTGAREDSHGNVVSTAGSAAALDRMNNLALVQRQINPDRSSVPVIGPDVPPAGISIPPLGERLNVNLPSSAVAPRWSLGILTSDYLLDLELSALEQEGRGEVISSPRLITANQREAFIQQGVEIPFLEASSSGAATVSFRDAVLELRVQPLITPDDRIILDLTVKKDTVGEIVQLFNSFIPSIDTREIQTQVLVDSGQTVVLGGVYEQTLRYDSNKVPVLGDIPGLGTLFRQRSNTNDKAELLIFVTPTILDDNVRLD